MKVYLTAIILIFAMIMQANSQATIPPGASQLQAARLGPGARGGQMNLARLSSQKANLVRLVARKNRLLDDLVNVNDQIDALIFEL